MLSFKQCKVITDNRLLLITLCLVVFIASMAEAMEIKRAGFVGMRGKKSVEQIMEDLYDADPDLYTELKRSGFVGMRGKKDNDLAAQLYAEAGPEYNLMEKKSSGFVGMRGKKESNRPTGYYYVKPSFYMPPRESRGSSNGFVGMRG